MFSIFDGREKFYQWDKDRMLIVDDPTIIEVHFANCLCPAARKCEVYDYDDGTRVADVPNSLLTEYMDIKVWAYDGEMTKHEATFEIIKRVKPEDYIYTNEEVKTWEQIYRDMCQHRFYYEQIDCLDIAKLPYLPFESLATTKNSQRWEGSNSPTISNPREFDYQEEVKLFVEDTYTNYERVAKFPMPAYMWSVDWLDGIAWIRMVIVKLDTSKLHEGENKGCLYTTFEEQGWPQIANGITPICSHFTQGGASLGSSKLRMMEDGRLRLCVNTSYTYEQALEAVKDLDIYFCYQPEERIRVQVCEPLETASPYEDNNWFYAYIEGIDEDNIRWEASYYEPMNLTMMNLEDRITELEDRITALEEG